MKRFARTLAVVLSLLMLAPTALTAQAMLGPTSDGPFAISRVDGPVGLTLLRMKAGTFDPAAAMPAWPDQLTFPSSPTASPVASDGRARFVLQFESGVNPDLIERLHARGIAYERYLPDGGMVASAEPRDIPPSPAAAGARALFPLHPALRLEPTLWGAALAGGSATVRLALLVFDTPAPERAFGPLVHVVAFDGRMAIVDAEESALLPLARLGGVEWVESYRAPAPLMNFASRTVGARQEADGAFLGDGRSVWAYNATTDSFSGLTGKGVIVNIGDTGIDGTHPAFDGRIVASFGFGTFNATCDCYSIPHGTHVAGIVAGNGSWRPEDTNRTDGKYAGVAPEAGLVAQMVFNNPRTPTQLSQEALSAGAFVNSNSWGGGAGGAYTSTSQTYDDLVLDANGRDAGAPQMVYVFAAGNSGPGATTVESPSTAKNVISVGATGNIRYSSPDMVVGFSSRGPTSDGRLKPDLVAPGEGVVSARGQNWGCEGGELNCSYYTLSGTSMATPAVSGSAALVTEWLNATRGAMPSAAMVKGVLIDGATPLPFLEWPDNNQGWGRVNVSRSVNEGPSFRHLTWDEGTALAEVAGRTTASFSFFAESDQELRVVLVWSDLAGTASSSKALINDLDLEVTGPDGRVFFGNGFAGGYSLENGTRDRGNNTEVVRIKAPARGVWNLTVRAASIPSGDQRFALVASGNITTKWVSLVPSPAEFLPLAPREDDPLTVIIPVRNQGTVYASSFRVDVVFSGPEGNTSRTASVLGVAPHDDFPATFVFTPKRGLHTLRISVDPGGTSLDNLPGDNNATASVFVEGFEVGLNPVTDIPSLPPLASATFLATVTNLGNTPDTVALNASASAGWAFELSVPSRALGPGESAIVSGTVHAPDRALAGETGTMRLNATSGGNASRGASLTLLVLVAPAPSSHVSQGDYSARVDPGGNATFGLTAENAGNVPLDFEVAADFAGSSPLGWTTTTNPAALRVAPYTSAALSVAVGAPPTALASEFHTVVVTVRSVQEAAQTQLVFEVGVNRTYASEVTPESSAGSADPGDTVLFPVLVHNGGNGRETFSFSVKPVGAATAGVLFSVENATLVVAPFGDGFATARAETRSFAAAGTFEAELSVQAAGGVTRRIMLSAEVRALHHLQVEPPSRISVRQGGSSASAVSLENLGNTAEQLGLLVDLLPAGLSVSGWTGARTLAPGESLTLALEVSASAGAPVGLAEVRLVLEPPASSGLQRLVANLTVDVRPPPAQASSFLPGLGGWALAAVALAGLLASAGARRGHRPAPRASARLFKK